MRQKNQIELNLGTGARGEALSVAAQETEARAAQASLERPAVAGPSMEAVVERENLKKALARVKRNKGAAGIDGMSVEDLSAYLLRQGIHADSPAWRNPDLILLDLNLPRMTGREVLDRIRGTPSLQTVPVVVLTTSRRQEDVQEMYAELQKAHAERDELKQRLHEAAMAKVWTNEDGKKFVFADDLKGPLLGITPNGGDQR